MKLRDRNQIAAYAITLGSILLLSLLFPNTLRFKYEFEEGKVWRYDDLISPYDFGVLKPKDELQREYQKIDSTYSNYYVKDNEKIVAVLDAFQNDFKNTLLAQSGANLELVGTQSQAYVDYGSELIGKYYARGIVNGDNVENGRDLENMQTLDGNQLITIEPLEVSEVDTLIRYDLANSNLANSSFLYPLIIRHIHPNIYFDPVLTDKLRKAEKDKIAVTRGKVSRGELIVAKEGVITRDIAQKLESFRIAHERQVSQNKSHWFVWSGYFILMSILLGVFTFYLWQWLDRKTYSVKMHLFILLGLLMFAFVSYLVEQNGTLSIYIVPFCIAPIVFKTFFDDKIAFTSYAVLIISIALIFSFDFEFVLLQMSAGLVALVSNKVTRYWTPFFRSILLIAITYMLGYLSLTVIKEGNLTSIDWNAYSWFVINTILVLLAYPLVPLLERIFGFTSAISLAELGDLNRPLLKELSFKAPGTFQHSLQVANIAEAAADAIGADSLLLRVSALYHDIGKMKEPEIFIENQADFNPHKNLEPLESARKIIDHVPNGVMLARKHGLPKSVIEMIKSHHGTTRVEFFYKASEARNQLPVDETSYTYPGPKPITREEVILMLADSIEAACKSLKHPNESDIQQMVDRIFAVKHNASQFSDSQISYAEMEIVRSSIKKVLQGIYHIRVEYPEDQITASESV
jgi:putative nucleotidyltransferase with HDIG domain